MSYIYYTWPSALAMEKVVKSHKTKGCRLMNPAKSNISPVIKRAEM
jgi:hypothetical protein